MEPRSEIMYIPFRAPTRFIRTRTPCKRWRKTAVPASKVAINRPNTIMESPTFVLYLSGSNLASEGKILAGTQPVHLRFFLLKTLPSKKNNMRSCYTCTHISKRAHAMSISASLHVEHMFCFISVNLEN